MRNTFKKIALRFLKHIFLIPDRIVSRLLLAAGFIETYTNGAKRRVSVACCIDGITTPSSDHFLGTLSLQGKKTLIRPATLSP
jgi:hypothetical protein